MLRDCSGAYVLLLYISSPIRIRSKAKEWLLKPGLYAYVGSAKRGIKVRVLRHLRKNKKKHWHIDYLLEKSDVKKIFVLCGANEQDVAEAMSKVFESIYGFGASDSKLKSHLFKIL